jgi:3-oxoacyl-[acyl-carrier protein] reductase
MNVLLTGGTRGLGLAIARELLGLEHHVFAIGRRQTEEFEAVRAAATGRLVFLPLDLADPEAIQAALAAQFETSTPIHALVNNAAVAYDDLVTNLQTEPLEAMFRVNVFAAMQLTRFAIRNMLLHKTAGSIVHVSSVCAHTGYKGLAMYAASKGALEGFSKSVAREWGRFGIRSNCVVPGFMDTDMSSTLDHERRQKIYKRTALQEPTSLASVAAMVGFLLGEKSRSVTGQSLVVDSGSL